MTTMLDADLLEQLEHRWLAGSPEVFERIAPGLSDAEIAEVARPLGFDLPDEVLRWFRWQNGSEPHPVIVARTFRSLVNAVSVTAEWQLIDEEVPQTWLNVVDNQPDLFFDCSGGAAAPARVWFYDVDRGFPKRPKFESIGEMVLQWVELIDAGHLVWRADRGGWWGHPDDATDALLELTGGAPLGERP
jgi:hypothetical protein